MSERIDLLVVLPKASDLETHVRLLHLGERQVLEFVDFVPSLDHYGRGYWVPVTDGEVLERLARALQTGSAT